MSAPRWPWSLVARRHSASSTDGRVGRQRREDRRYLSGCNAPGDHLSSRAHYSEQIGRGEGRFSITSGPRPRVLCGKNTALDWPNRSCGV
jgi:hypothetical protein